jgi:hypothetical protein
VPHSTQNLAPDITGVPHCGQNRIYICTVVSGLSRAGRP